MEAHWRSSQFKLSASRGSVTRRGDSNQWAGDAPTEIAQSITLSNVRSVGGCLGYVHLTDEGRVVGGCVGTVDDSRLARDARRPVGGCVGYVYSRRHTRFVGGYVGAIEMI